MSSASSAEPFCIASPTATSIGVEGATGPRSRSPAYGVNPGATSVTDAGAGDVAMGEARDDGAAGPAVPAAVGASTRKVAERTSAARTSANAARLAIGQKQGGPAPLMLDPASTAGRRKTS